MITYAFALLLSSHDIQHCLTSSVVWIHVVRHRQLKLSLVATHEEVMQKNFELLPVAIT